MLSILKFPAKGILYSLRDGVYSRDLKVILDYFGGLIKA